MMNPNRLFLRLLITFNHGFFLLLILSNMSHHAAAQFAGEPPPPPSSSLGPRVDLKMAIVMVLLVMVFFVLGFLSVYTRQCAQDRFGGRFDLGLGGSGAGGWVAGGGAARGLDPEIIETFPTFVYSTVKGLKIGKGSLECAVCLNEFEDNETLRLIPKCDHVFHPDCIDAWLLSHSTCPVCRASLIPKPGDSQHPTLADIMNPIEDPGQPNRASEPDETPLPLPRQMSIRAGNEEPLPTPQPAQPEVISISESGGVRTSQGRPPRSRSTGFGFVPPRSRSTGRPFGGIFSRSHSTGHDSLVRPGESLERFTLRLPEEVRTQLVNSTLNRTKSSGAALPRVGSSRKGYRSGSGSGGVGRGNIKDNFQYERFEPDGPPDRWVFSVVPPFFSRTGSVRSSKDDVAISAKPPTSRDDVGERSSDPLRPDDQV